MGEQKTALILLLTLCFAIVSISQIGLVKAEGTIYIRADGSVEGTDKIQIDGDIYTFTDNIVNQSIVVESDNIVICGIGYTLRGNDVGYGIFLQNRTNVTIMNIQIMNFEKCVGLMESSNNTITGNSMTHANSGIEIFYSDNNSVNGNYITENWDGIYLKYGENNLVDENDISNNWRGIKAFNTITSNLFLKNNITNNEYGIWLEYDANQVIHHNNFINNTGHVVVTVNAFGYIPPPEGMHIFDNGYPSGGNYWDNYNGTDTNHDGIGDTLYLVSQYRNNTDNYPLMEPVIIPPIIIPEFPLLTILLILLLAVIVVAVIYRRMLHTCNRDGRKR
jgi:parallel beta-helix repeat protein